MRLADRPRRDDRGERGRGQPADLQGRRAHGDRAVLRPVLSRDDPRVQEPRGRPPRAGHLRRVPRGARSGRVAGEQDGGHPAADGGDVQQLSAADTLGPRDQPTRAGEADLRAVPLARAAGFGPRARHLQVRRGRGEHAHPDRAGHDGGRGRRGGIHGSHLGPGIEIRYAAADAKRQVIPWVEYKDTRRACRAPISRRRPRPRRRRPCRSTRCSASTATIAATHAFDSPERRRGQGPRGRPDLHVSPVHQEEGRRGPEGQLCEQRGGGSGDPGGDRQLLQASASRPLPGPRGRHRRARAEPWPPSTAATCSPISRSPGGPIRTTSGTTPFPAASAATTRATRPSEGKTITPGLRVVSRSGRHGRGVAGGPEDPWRSRPPGRLEKEVESPPHRFMIRRST